MRGEAKAKPTRGQITAAVDVLERLTYIDDEAEATIKGTGTWYLNKERATLTTRRALERIKVVDDFIRELEDWAFALEKSHPTER